VVQCPLVDAWSHRAVEEALNAAPGRASMIPQGPHRAAHEATRKSARLASAVELSARELEASLNEAATRLRGDSSRAFRK